MFDSEQVVKPVAVKVKAIMQKKVLIVVIVAGFLCSGLASSQSVVDAESVLKYFASFYIPSEQQTTARAMMFGQEFRPENHADNKSSNELPDRNFLR
ncbi:MAG: hypothetical protein CVV41_17805 [Candidatus Riflebacteria bacterium HGW-Riflebacteria-1]|nr:MAG: hypothetical protein CVV41_17805 [Candidatus Riflebacteria bacterium HGW-Riflebacteria-1]